MNNYIGIKIALGTDQSEDLSPDAGQAAVNPDDSAMLDPDLGQVTNPE